MMAATVKDLAEDLPAILTMPETGKVLRLSRAAAYTLAHRKDFPCLRVGKSIRVPRQAFIAWVNTQAAEGLSDEEAV